MFDDVVDNGDVKFQIEGVFNNAKEIKEKFRLKCLDKGVTAQVGMSRL